MYELITNEEMSNYMNQVLNSEALRNAYCGCTHPSDANNIYMNLGNILAKYYISTGDDSLESAQSIIEDYVSAQQLGRGGEHFFKECLMPRIETKVASTLNIDGGLSLKDRARIQEYVDIRNTNNLFYTHCFPGALYEEVSANGLDISKELFKEEYGILSTCFKTSYQTGNLNYCELSAASLGYAVMGMPERARFALGSGIKQLDGESLHDACDRCFENNLQAELQKGTIDEEKMEEMRAAGTRIIDFYCKSKSCVAFFRKNEQIVKTDSNIEEKIIKTIKDLGVNLNGTYFRKLF